MSEQTGSGQSRYLHTMLRVKNLDASVRFYTDLFGMKELRRNEVPGGKYTLAFLGYGDESTHTVLELTYNWGKDDPYEIGTAFGHLAVELPGRLRRGREDEGERARRSRARPARCSTAPP